MSQDAWLELLAAAGAGGNGWHDALQRAGSCNRLLGMSSPELRATGLGNREIALLHRSRAPAEWRDWLGRDAGALITFGSPDYPERLAAIADPPLALWITGARAGILGDPQLAIVGSRHPTRNGELAAGGFARDLSRAGLSITSGLALGVDAASHRGALEGLSGTIAVLGSGIDTIYPHRNRKLADEIRTQGLIVSEYGPGVPARPWQFPRRNRIIAALGLGTLVVEATRRSGSLITARLAAEFGREVYAVPGSIHSALSRGCHKLIRDGAKLVEQTADILVEIAPQLSAITAGAATDDAVPDATNIPSQLRDTLDFSPVSFDSMLQVSGLTAAELSSMLLHLELQGKIEALPGGRYCRIAKRA